MYLYLTLEKCFQTNEMKLLSHLTLDHCHGVTLTTINSVMDAQNDLAILRVWSCAAISRVHSLLISQRISDENLDLYFEWFQYG